MALYEKEQGATMNEIAKRIGRDKSTVTALVNKLEKLGFVEKIRNSNDSRSTLVKLTNKGLQTKPIVIDKISKELLAITYKNFSNDEKEVLFSLLKKIENNFLI